MKLRSRTKNPLPKRARKGFRGYPVATIAFYGPDDRHATKVAVGIVLAKVLNLNSWNGGTPRTVTYALTRKPLNRFALSYRNMMLCLLRWSTGSSDVRMKRVLTIPMAQMTQYEIEGLWLEKPLMSNTSLPKWFVSNQ